VSKLRGRKCSLRHLEGQLVHCASFDATLLTLYRQDSESKRQKMSMGVKSLKSHRQSQRIH